MNTRSQASRRAFTLVELLVVIAIIGMLAGLLLPAVQRAREAGRTTTCLNNMRNLSVAMQTYEARKRELPGYANVVGKSSSTAQPKNPPDRLGTWVVMLFPQIDRSNEYTSWTADPAGTSAGPPDTPYIALLVCPSNPPNQPNTPALSYVANCGKRDFGAMTAPPVTSAANASNYTKAEKMANGVFFDRWTDDTTTKNNATSGFIRILMTTDHIPDGASNTLMLSENNQAVSYISGGPFNSSTGVYNANANNPARAEKETGFVWDPAAPQSLTSNPPTTLGINGDKDRLKPNPPYTDNMYIRPSSQHPGGVNVATCGGETLFLNEAIDYVIYCQLMTSNDKKSDIPNASSLSTLNDSDWR
jgi:prepilin-type N-terminal cleavage/methylation domain-containing protein